MSLSNSCEQFVVQCCGFKKLREKEALPVVRQVGLGASPAIRPLLISLAVLADGPNLDKAGLRGLEVGVAAGLEARVQRLAL